MISIAETLRAKRNKLADTWRRRVQQNSPGVAPKDAALINHVPQIIDALATVCEGRLAPQRICDAIDCGQVALVRALGRTHEFGEILEEFRILREVLLDACDAMPSITAADYRRVLDGMFFLFRDLGNEFGKRLVQVEREHAEVMRRERDLRDALISALAHDLRTPLVLIKAHGLAMLRHGDDAARRNVAAAQITETVDRMESMVQNLLDSMRAHAGERLQLQITEFDLQVSLAALVTQLKTVYGDLLCWRSGERVVGFWSEQHVRRAVANLIDNAVKHGTHGKPVTMGVDADQGLARVWVHNWGTPIPLEEVPRLFRPFIRRGTTTKPGWGIGLAVVHAIAEAHGGKVNIDSTASAGTRFNLMLPKDSRPFQPQPK
jgi:signal transduction histidine kinase